MMSNVDAINKLLNEKDRSNDKYLVEAINIAIRAINVVDIAGKDNHTTKNLLRW